jgi:selenide,water dikinase
MLELARAAQLSARLEMGLIPLLPQVQQLAEKGYITGASGRNWNGYAQDVALAENITSVQRSLLTDPQTSGGLLVSCDPAVAGQVLELFRREGFADAAVIGEMTADGSAVEVLS